MMKSERVTYVDIAKGFVLLLVIFGHTFRDSMREAYYWCDFSYLFLYKFHGSALFLLSGVSYAITAQKNKSLSLPLYLKKKAKSILLPWVSYSVLVYIIFFAVSKVPVLSGALGGKGVVSPIEYLRLMLYNQNPYSFHLWYLNTLFLLSVFTFLIDRFSDEKNTRILKFGILIIIPAIASTVAQPWHLVTKGFVYQLPYFIIGTLIKRDTFEKSCHKWITAGGLSAVLLAVHTILEPSYDFSAIGNVAVFYIENILAVLVAFGIISASYALSGRLSFVEKIGRNSMVYYLYHQPFCCAFLGALLYDKLCFPVILVIVICMIVSLVVPYFISKIAKRTGLHKILRYIGLPS